MNVAPPPTRERCQRCWRPQIACYCAKVTPLETRTKLVLLQHPRERDVAIGTARMASLCLTNSELHVGIDWSESPDLARALSDSARPPILLYPGEGAIDIVRDPPKGPVTLVVVDGTWWQTRKVVRTNPVLQALPRYAFVAPRPSEYRIRKEPDEAYVATIEALVHVLSVLEGDADRFGSMLAPFKAMIDFQVSCQTQYRGARVRHARRRARDRRMRVPRALTDRPEDLLCVAAEANAWPHTMRDTDPAYADELVLWAAHRPATGETFSYVVAPRRHLAPGTAPHTGIDEAVLRAGGSLDDLHAIWRSIVRDTDVICSWGHYETSLFAAGGGFLPAGHLDVRRVAREVSRGSVGTLEEYAERAGHPVERSGVVGRAGRKLDGLRSVIAGLRAAADHRGVSADHQGVSADHQEVSA